MSDDLDKPYFTMKNLPVRFDSIDSNVQMFSGYLLAIDRIMPGYLKLAEVIDNFDALTVDELKTMLADTKKQIIDYTNEHIQFRDRIDYLRNDDDALCAEVDTLPTALRP